MFGVAEQTYVIVVSKIIGSQLHLIITSIGIVITVIYTAVIPAAASLKYDCYVCIPRKQMPHCLMSARSLFYPETQVLDSSCKHGVVSSRSCVILLYVHLTLCFIAR